MDSRPEYELLDLIENLNIILEEKQQASNNEIIPEILNRIEDIVTKSNACSQGAFTLLSVLMSNEDKEIVLRVLRIMTNFAFEQNRCFHFMSLFSNIDYNFMNKTLESIGIVNYIYCYLLRRRHFLSISNQDIRNECESKMSHWKNIVFSTNENIFTNEIYEYLFDLFNDNVILRKPLYIEMECDRNFIMIGSGLCMFKFLNKRPLLSAKELNTLSEEDMDYFCKMMSFTKYKISFYFIRSIMSNNKVYLSKNCISNIILYFYNLFTDPEKEGEFNLNLDENEIVKKIYEHSENGKLLSNKFERNYIMEIFFHFLVKYKGHNGFNQIQRSVRYPHLWQILYEYITNNLSDPHSELMKIDINKHITKKFVYIFLENFVLSVELCINYYKGIEIMFKTIDVKFFLFLENLILQIKKKELDKESQYKNIFCLLEFAKVNYLFNFDEKFLNHINNFCKDPDRDEIFNRLNQGVLHFHSRTFDQFLIFTLEFFKNFTKLLDKYNYFPLWKLFENLSKEYLRNYDPDHDQVLNWLTSKLSQNYLDERIIELLKDYIKFFDNKNNPVIKSYLKEQIKQIVPELRSGINEYEEFMNQEDLSLSDLNIKSQVEEGERVSNPNFSSENHSDHMTNKEKEENLKEKMQEIIKFSQDKRDFYEDIFQNLVIEVKDKNKNLNSILLNILNRKIIKNLYNLNKNLTQHALNYNNIIGNTIDKYLENIHHPHLKLSHIILKIQICFTYNIIKFSHYSSKSGGCINNFVECKASDVRIMLDNCFKSLYVEANRAFNKSTNKGDLFVIEEENEINNFENINDSAIYNEKISEVDSNSIIGENTTHFPINESINESENYHDLEEKEEISFLQMEIFNNYDNYSVSKNLSIDLSNNSKVKSTFMYSKYSHIFSFTGYTNLVNKSHNEMMKEISLLMKSDYLPKEILDKFKEYLDVIINLEILFMNEGKGEEFYELWKKENKEKLERNQLDLCVIELLKNYK